MIPQTHRSLEGLDQNRNLLLYVHRVMWLWVSLTAVSASSPLSLSSPFFLLSFPPPPTPQHVINKCHQYAWLLMRDVRGMRNIETYYRKHLNSN